MRVSTCLSMPIREEAILLLATLALIVALSAAVGFVLALKLRRHSEQF